jgi:hypothetical protein
MRSRAKTPAPKPFHQRDGADRKRRSISRSVLSVNLPPLSWIKRAISRSTCLKYFLNGMLVSNIVIDTSAIATDTIDYVATNQAGNTATSTRAVIVESPATAEPAPTP